MAFARGKHAYGFCDRCGFRYPLKKLRNEIQDRVPTNLYVCPTCYDEDQPQQWIGDIKVDDPRPLRNPRPDPALAESRRLFSWDPVGGGVYAFGNETLGLKATSAVGQVTVNTRDYTASPTGVEATGAVGSVTLTVATIHPSGEAGTASVGSVTVSIS